MPLHANSLYIILLHLRTVGGEQKYHWELLLTGSTPPSGIAYHATDTGRAALDLYRESYPTRSGMLQSRTVVAALYVGPIGKDQLVWATQDSVTNLMNPRALPRGEPRWTCRVWVKTVLANAQAQKYIQLPDSLDSIELCALATADQHVGTKGRATEYNNLKWLSNKTRTYVSNGLSRTTPMDIDSPSRPGMTPMTGVSYHNTGRRTGTKPMQGIEYQSTRRR